MARELLNQYETHALLIQAKATIDFVFAFGDVDDNGDTKGNALQKNGVKALGIARKIPIKDRALGRADAEISLDGDWWKDATDAQRRALLDHELHHLTVKMDNTGLLLDDLGRPVIAMRKHDVEIGWFIEIARRHKGASLEVTQAGQIMDESGQYFWPLEEEAPKKRRAA